MRNLIWIGVLFLSSFAFGQEQTKDSVQTVVEKQAEFPGGREAMIVYLSKNIKQVVSPYKGKKYYGKTQVKFVVSAQGKVSNVKIEKQAENCPKCDKAAVKVISEMPDWIPGLNNGKPVNQWITLPIGFQIG